MCPGGGGRGEHTHPLASGCRRFCVESGAPPNLCVSTTCQHRYSLVIKSYDACKYQLSRSEYEQINNEREALGTAKLGSSENRFVMEQEACPRQRLL